jgi:hypothetical protein
MTKCLVCEREIGENERAVWFLNATAICKNCEFKRIIVFHFTGEHAGGCYEKDINRIAGLIKEIAVDESCIVTKRKMAAVKYHGLPEFAGF